jgi:BirA family transcriptional regulator, biotin operon repressor / biotin---[acetyl-CoA-carboxylase] ligase
MSVPAASPQIEGDPPLYRFASIESTNTEALRLGQAGAPHLTAVCAGYQSAGRGQFERRWLMPEGQGVLLSVLYRQMPPGIEFTTLTLQVGRVMADLLGGLAGLRVGVKEPNDLVIEGKKLGGILSEARWRSDQFLYAVVGIGINVNVLDFPDEIRDTACSLAQKAGRMFDVEEVLQAVLHRLRNL